MAPPPREVNDEDGIVGRTRLTLTCARAPRYPSAVIVPAITRGEARGGVEGSPALVVLSALQLLLVAIDTLVIAPLAVAVALLNENASYRLCRVWVRLNLFLYGVRVDT